MFKLTPYCSLSETFESTSKSPPAKRRLGLVRQVHVHLRVEHSLGDRHLEVADRSVGMDDALRTTPGQQAVEQLRGKTLVVLGHTSPSPQRAVYGSSHGNPDTASMSITHFGNQDL